MPEREREKDKLFNSLFAHKLVQSRRAPSDSGELFPPPGSGCVLTFSCLQSETKSDTGEQM